MPFNCEVGDSVLNDVRSAVDISMSVSAFIEFASIIVSQSPSAASVPILMLPNASYNTLKISLITFLT